MKHTILVIVFLIFALGSYVASSVSQSAIPTGSPFLVIKAIPETSPDKGVKSRRPGEVRGKIMFGHDAAGGNFWINGGKKKQYTLGYLWDFDEITKDTLNKLTESEVIVTAKGILKIWKDGSRSFDNTEPITIFK